MSLFVIIYIYIYRYSTQIQSKHTNLSTVLYLDACWNIAVKLNIKYIAAVKFELAWQLQGSSQETYIRIRVEYVLPAILRELIIEIRIFN
jgi:hypothetical protein